MKKKLVGMYLSIDDIVIYVSENTSVEWDDMEGVRKAWRECYKLNNQNKMKIDKENRKMQEKERNTNKIQNNVWLMRSKHRLIIYIYIYIYIYI